MAETNEHGVKSAPRGFLPVMGALGPGIVLAGGVVGSGELINTPIQAAKFGFILLWAVIIACLIKYFLQVEIARHCVVHNRSVFEAMNFVPGPRYRNTSWAVWAFILAWAVVQVGSAGTVGAIAGVIHGLVPVSTWFPAADAELASVRSVQVWSLLVVGVGLLLMWRGLYNHFEKIIIVLVLGFSVTVLLGLVMLQGTDFAIKSTDISEGMTFSLGDDTRAAAFAVIALMGGLGVSGIELLVYPYWIHEKGYAKFLGDPNSPGWSDRARGWIRIIKIDAAAATILATVITAAFFLLGCAILHRQGIQPEGIGVVDKMSAIFTGTYGNWSRGLFLVGAFCTLFSTLLHATAANARIFTDFFASVGFIDRQNFQSVNFSHRIVQALFLLVVLMTFLLLPSQPEQLVLLSHYLIGLVGTPIAIIAILFLAFQTDRRVRMNGLTTLLLVTSVAVILFCVGLGFAFQRGWIN